MSQENVALIRDWFEGQQDPEQFFGLLDPCIVFINYASAPEPGPFVGHDGVRAWVRNFRSGLGDFRIDATEIIDAGGDQVVVDQLVVGTGISSGVPFERRFSSLFTLANGKIVRVQGFETHAEALEAAGLSK